MLTIVGIEVSTDAGVVGLMHPLLQMKRASPSVLRQWRDDAAWSGCRLLYSSNIQRSKYDVLS